MKDITKNLEFVLESTLDNIKHSSIEKSLTHGFGLFSTKDIDECVTLGCLDGQIITIVEYENLKKRIENEITPYANFFFMECNYIDDEKILARAFRTKYSYINHSRTPNLKIDLNNMSIISTKNILAGDEFLLDYREESLPDDYLNGAKGEYL